MKIKEGKIKEGRLVPYIFVALACVLAVVIFGVRVGGSEEAKVEKMVGEMAEAAETKDIKGVLRYISEDYTDNHGNDKTALKGFLLSLFFRGEKVSVFVRSVEVALRGDRGLLKVKAVLVMGRSVESISDVVPDEAAGYSFDSVVTKDGGRWKVLSVNWKKVGVFGLL